jgi:hypothetical protein
MLAARVPFPSAFIVPGSVPVWLVAIAAGAAAPVCVRWYASLVEKHARRRTERALTAPSHEERFEAGSREDGKQVDG